MPTLPMHVLIHADQQPLILLILGALAASVYKLRPKRIILEW